MDKKSEEQLKLEVLDYLARDDRLNAVRHVNLVNPSLGVAGAKIFVEHVETEVTPVLMLRPRYCDGCAHDTCNRKPLKDKDGNFFCYQEYPVYQDYKK
jgi:hypothetical protein